MTGNGSALDNALDCMARYGRVALLGCTRNSDFTIDYYHKVHGPGITLIGAHTDARPIFESSNGWWTHSDDVKALINLTRLNRISLSDIVDETQSPNDAKKIYDRIFAKDFGMAILEYKNGLSFAKTVNSDHGGFHRRQLVITGSKASIEIKPIEWYIENDEIHTVKREYSSISWHDDGKKSVTAPFDRYDGMMAAFAKMVRGEYVNPYTYDYELTLYKTLLKCCDIK